MSAEGPLRSDIRRIVVKIGTNTLCDPTGRPDDGFLGAIARDIHLLRSQGREVLIISSGAIGSGMHAIGLLERPQDVTARQALAAIGQHRLMTSWQKAFQPSKTQVAQLLLTHHTFDKRRSYLHLRSCLEHLLGLGVVPIINENDTVSVQEIDATFGDNDRLGALVAAKVEADLYVILSDVEGLYDRAPHRQGAKIVRQVAAITDEVIAMAGDKAGRNATGGMASKLRAARSLTEAGIPVAIAYGRRPGVLGDLLAKEAGAPRPGTWFEAVGHRDGRSRWLLAAHPQGRILVDAGAVAALRDGFHLLPAGVTGVEPDDGGFPVESVVDIVHDGVAVARALCHLSSRDLEVCKGMQSDEARQALRLDGPVNITRKGRIALL